MGYDYESTDYKSHVYSNALHSDGNGAQRNCRRWAWSL